MTAVRDGRPSSAQPLVSVVLLNYNGLRFARLWESFFRETYPHREILFVDNGSTDGSGEAFRTLAARYAPQAVRVVRLEQNVGYSEGNNVGVREARGTVVAVVNNDIEVSEDWIAPVVQAFASDPKLGVVQSRLMSLQNRDQADRVWNRLDAWGFSHAAPEPSAELEPVFYAEGAAMFVRRELLDDLGSFYPSEFYMLGEDADLCWRARMRGWRVGVLTTSRAWHARGGTEEGSVTKRNPKVLRAITRNRLAMLFTNYGRARQLVFVPGSMALAVVRGALLWGRRDRTHARAVFAGLRDFLHDLPVLSERRRRVQRRRTVPDQGVVPFMMGPIDGLRSLRSLWSESLQGGGADPRAT